MKCAIYARVSTDEQGTSIINQQEYFKDYIKRHNLEIFDIYSDEAFSGTETRKRLSFQRLLQDGKNKKYEVLLAKSYSRFGRNQRETLTALADLFEHGIRIIFVEDGLDSLRDKGQFGLFAWLAEQESRKISERLKMTWQLYNKEGKIHNSRETYGYNYDATIRNFVVNRDEAVVVRMIFDLYLQGYGINRIAVFLNKNGHAPKYGKQWYGSPVYRVLLNEFYLGHLTQGKFQTIDITIKKQRVLDKNEWVIHKNNHEAIIPEELFYKVQDEIKKRKAYLNQFEAVRYSTAHLFSNLIRCKICGASSVAIKRRVRHGDIAYSCIEYQKNGAVGCGHKRNAMLEKDLMQIIHGKLEALAVNNFETIRNYYQSAEEKQNHKQGTINVNVFDEQIAEQTKLSNSLLSLFTEGVIGIEQYKLQNASLAERIKALSQQKEEALLEQETHYINNINEEETINAIQVLLENQMSEWTNEMMKRVIQRICIDKHNNEVEIKYVYEHSSI